MTERILRRKLTRPAAPPAAAVGPHLSPPAQGLGRALVRAVDAGAGLTARPDPATERGVSLAEGLDLLEPDGFLALVAPVADPAAVCGLVRFDPGLFSALIEVIAVGTLGAEAPDPARRATATDAALLGAIVDRMLSELDRAVPAAEGDGPGCGPWRMARSLGDPRLLGAILDEGGYRLIDMALRVSAAGAPTGPERAGRVTLLVPALGAASAPVAPVPQRPAPAEGGTDRMGAAAAVLMAAPAVLEAVLGRIGLPIERAMRLRVGDRLELPLSALEEVGLVGPGGRIHARGRLGQSRGLRAVRLLDLVDDEAPPPGLAAPEVPGPPGAPPRRLGGG